MRWTRQNQTAKYITHAIPDQTTKTKELTNTENVVSIGLQLYKADRFTLFTAITV